MTFASCDGHSVVMAGRRRACGEETASTAPQVACVSQVSCQLCGDETQLFVELHSRVSRKKCDISRKRRDMSRGSAALTIRVMLCFGGFVRRAALQHLIAASCCSRCWCSCSTLRSSFRSRSHCRSRSRSRALNFSNSSSRSLARSLSRCISRSRSKSLSSSLSRSNRIASCTHNRISLAQKTKRD